MKKYLFLLSIVLLSIDVSGQETEANTIAAFSKLVMLKVFLGIFRRVLI